MPHPEQGIGRGGHLPIGVDEIRGPFVEIGGEQISGENLSRQGLEPPLPGDLSERELAGLERQVEVFELLRAVGRLDAGRQVRGELPLPLDRSQDRLLAVSELTGLEDRAGDATHVDLVETAGLVTAIPRDERNRVPIVEQLHRGGDAGGSKPQTLGDLSQIDDRYGCHPTGVAGPHGPVATPNSTFLPPASTSTSAHRRAPGRPEFMTRNRRMSNFATCLPPVPGLSQTSRPTPDHPDRALSGLGHAWH